MILAPISVGELIDKITILEIKMEKITDDAKRKNCEKEFLFLNQILIDQKISFPIQKEKLKKVNEILWDVEDRIRILEKNKDFGPVFIDLARQVYHTNDERFRLKSEINALSGSSLNEEKQYENY